MKSNKWLSSILTLTMMYVSISPSFASSAVEKFDQTVEINTQSLEFNNYEELDYASSVQQNALDEPAYGGFIKNRKTSMYLGMRCAEHDANGACVSFSFVTFKESELDTPSKWTEINPNHSFTHDDLAILQTKMNDKIKYRVDPRGYTLPYMPLFPLSMMVWVLDQQNRDGGGPRFFIKGLYVVSVPVDTAILIPTVVGAVAVWGVKRGVIAIQQSNVKKGISVLEKSGKLKKLSGKNFDLMVSLIRQF